MNVSGIDLNPHLSTGKIQHYEVGSVFALSIALKNFDVLLPDCDTSHETVGLWLLDGLDVHPKIMNQEDKVVIDMSKYGFSIDGIYQYPPPIYFIEIPGWELIAEQNPFNHTVSLYFRPLRKY